MSITELKITFPTEKLNALRFFMEKKQQTPEQDLQEYLDKAYEKMVPAQVREYVESHMEQPAVQQQTQEAGLAPAGRERPARQSRRQREQTASATPNIMEVQAGAGGPGEEETPGMTMSM
ncbi:DUF6103 family protein [Desulfitobacterium hafniense]|uniref:DUF6103 family protein n=1 Tax=Desulfitobacterium hafniense TaxID=49338 RepID=UPI00030FDEAB|nr:DUF6103 family protein [Desulfitobacterium hafniense]